LAFYLGKASPRSCYEGALAGLSREKGVRVPRSITLASAFGKLSAVCFGLVAGLVAYLLSPTPLLALPAGWTAMLGIKLCLFPRIAGYREWALKEIEENGGLWDISE
jgi:hypothetical protein